jgi:uncharacterized protein YjbK
MTPTEPTQRQETEFKLRVRDESDFDTLTKLVAGDTASGRTEIQENHFFDTPQGALRRGGYALRLRFEGARRVLTAKGAATSADVLRQRPEDEADIDAVEAERILSGALAPLERLRLALAPTTSALVDAIEHTAGESALAHVGSFRNVRRYVGPVDVAGVDVTFEMDRTEFPGGRIDHEVEVEVELAGEELERFEAELRATFARAGIPWKTAPSKARRFFEALEKTGAR